MCTKRIQRNMSFIKKKKKKNIHQLKVISANESHNSSKTVSNKYQPL